MICWRTANTFNCGFEFPLSKTCSLLFCYFWTSRMDIEVKIQKVSCCTIRKQFYFKTLKLNKTFCWSFVSEFETIISRWTFSYSFFLRLVLFVVDVENPLMKVAINIKRGRVIKLESSLKENFTSVRWKFPVLFTLVPSFLLLFDIKSLCRLRKTKLKSIIIKVD